MSSVSLMADLFLDDDTESAKAGELLKQFGISEEIIRTGPGTPAPSLIFMSDAPFTGFFEGLKEIGPKLREVANFLKKSQAPA